MEIPETKRFTPERFELDTTLSLLTWSMFDDETISNENLFETVMSGSFKGLYLVLYAKQNTMNELQLRKSSIGSIYYFVQYSERHCLCSSGFSNCGFRKLVRYNLNKKIL